MKELNNINHEENNTLKSNKYSKFVENTKRAVRKALITTWIAASTMGPMATNTTFANRAELTKPKVEIDGSHTVIPTDPNYTPSCPWTTDAIFSAMWDDWNTAKVTVDNLTNELSEYKAIEITNIKPVDIIPILWQIEWDKNAYNRIEHLRIAEATRIRDMMREYGAWKYSPKEYQQLMNRLNTGMTGEIPAWYDNYEILSPNRVSKPSSHAHNERNILNTIVKHANFKIIDWDGRRKDYVYNTIKNEDNINIFWCSNMVESNKENILILYKKSEDLLKLKNFLLFCAWTNIRKKDWILKNKIYQIDTDTNDENWIYSRTSMANWKKDTNIDKHLIVTVWTWATWDFDQTNTIFESSKFPVWFNDKILFAWRIFPYLNRNSWKIIAGGGQATSYPNYVNVAIADLCFQMKADVTDVDELLEMIRNSSNLRDYIRFDLNGDGDTDDTCDGQPETQPLILMNPAWFFQKYLMPTNLPISLRTNETIDLEKGYYHGVIYQIPGAEVNINGQRIAFSDENKDLILAQNPMTLKWRLNGELLNSYNYKPGDTINGQIIVIDDMWNGLNITKDFSVSIEEVNGINDTKIAPSTPNSRYTIDGHRLKTKPSKPGIYIVNGKKVIIK